MSIITLSREQTECKNEALDSIMSGASFLLEGSAGTGKTTIVKDFTNDLKSYNKKYILTAPTHKAAAVLSRKTYQQVKTIHAHLSLKMERDNKGGYKLIKHKSKKKPLENVCVILDEASMVDELLFEHIEYDILKNNNTYLFCGDYKQLPPVNEKKSKVFTEVVDKCSLLTIRRQSNNNDNIYLSNNLDLLKTKEDGNFYSWLEDPVNQAASLMVDKNAVFIAYTNKSVHKANIAARKYKYDNPKQFEVGEKLIFNGQYDFNKTRYLNSEEIYVNSIRVSTATVHGVKYKGLVINNCVWTLENSEIEKFEENKKKLILSCKQGKTKWYKYYNLIERFADLHYTYATTCHKSQGSTYDNSIVYVSEMMRSDISDKLLYTGLTRTSNYNYLI